MTSVRMPALSLCTVLLVGCGSTPPAADNRTTEQVVAQTTGRRVSINDNVRQGVGFAIAPIEARCRKEGGTLTDEKLTSVRFLDRRGAQGPRGVTLPSRVVCKAGDRLMWGAELRVLEAQYLVATSVGDGVNYYGSVATEYLSGEYLASERTRLATDRSNEQRAREARTQECAVLREAYTKRVQAAPVPGMKVAFGMIIEVRGSLALVQYDSFGRQVKQREQEWVQVSSLGPGEDCPR